MSFSQRPENWIVINCKALILKVLPLIPIVLFSDAKHQSLRTTTIERDLSQSLFLNYEPRTNVIDHSRIDLDQKEIDKEVSQKTEDGLQNALTIYKNGAHSKLYAILTLEEELPMTLDEDTHVNGMSVLGKAQSGKLSEKADKGATTIKVLYATSMSCNVHGLLTEMNGCFAETGKITLGYPTVQAIAKYSYNITEETKNDRTLQKFSTDAESKMRSYRDLPYGDYLKFFKYYGKHDYANQWIMAAVESTKTDFLNGNVDFNGYSEESRIEVVRKSISYMNIWMYVIREMEMAIDHCNICKSSVFNSCDTGQAEIAWDAAVAFYVGSLEDGSGSGYMPFVLANQVCQNFDTCSSRSSGEAIVNIEIMDQFLRGQLQILSGSCEDIRLIKEKIVQLMTVPLIQGAIRYAYIMGVQNDTREKTKAEAAVFAASIVPMVNACNATDANTISRNMMGTDKPVFQEVKAAFENSFQCLGITCENIGGLLDRPRGKNQYLEGAKPCVFVHTDNNTENGSIYIVIFIVVVILMASLIILCVCRSWQANTNMKESDNCSTFSGIREDVEKPIDISN